MKTVWTKASHDDFLEIIKDTKKVLKQGLYSGGNVFFANDVLRYFISRQTKNNFEHTKNNLFINFLVNARKFSPGAEVILADLIVNNRKQKSVYTSRLSSSDALRETKKYITSNTCELLLDEMVEIMGTSGRIHITEEPIVQNELILRDKYQLQIGVDPHFAKMVNFKNDVYGFCHVCVIEGAPASVAELNALLNYCYEKNIFLILLGRSFPKDVTNTLAVNWQKNKLKVLPLVYGNSIYNLNAHADLCSISGATPINTITGSGLRGDLSETFGSLTNVQVGLNTISATGSCSPSYLVKDLSEKLSKLNLMETDKRDIILNRLAGLSSKTLHVKIYESPNSWQIKNELEVAIAIYNGFCREAAFVTFECGQTKAFPTHVYKKVKNMHNVYVSLVKNIGGYIVHNETKLRINNH